MLMSAAVAAMLVVAVGYIGGTPVAYAATVRISGGTAKITHARTGEVTKLTDNAVAILEPGDELSTGNGTAIITYFDDQKSTVLPGARLTLVTLERNGNATQVELAVWQGRTDIQLGQPLGPEDRFEVKSPSSTAVVRDAKMAVVVEVRSETETAYAAPDGNASVIMGDKVAEVKPGEQVVATVGEELEVSPTDIAQGIPGIPPVISPSPTEVPTPVVTDTALPTSTTTPTLPPQPTETAAALPTPRPTDLPTQAPPPTSTASPQAILTSTAEPTATPLLPTREPTPTAVPPTREPTPTPVTATREPSPTATAAPPTREPTPTQEPTDTPLPTSTSTPEIPTATATATTVPTDTPTVEPTVTDTPTPVVTNTATADPTVTPVIRPSVEPTVVTTPLSGETVTPIPTSTPAPVETSIPFPTETPSPAGTVPSATSTTSPTQTDMLAGAGTLRINLVVAPAVPATNTFAPTSSVVFVGPHPIEVTETARPLESPQP
jgi:hypothetical protein